jgi:hypothetical protein
MAPAAGPRGVSHEYWVSRTAADSVSTAERVRLFAYLLFVNPTRLPPIRASFRE